MAININDTFQVKLNGQVVDCIKADALNRETEKSSVSMYFVDYNGALNIISLKKESDPDDNTVIWVAKSNGTYRNSDGNYGAFSIYDLLTTTFVSDGVYDTVNHGNLVTAENVKAKTEIVDSIEDMYAMTNVPKGANVMVYSDGVYTVYTKINEKFGSTNSDDWVATGTSVESITSFKELPDSPDLYYVLKAANETVDESISRIYATNSKVPKYMDIVVVKETTDNTEAGTVVSVISYIYSGTKFVVLNDSVPADKIIINKDITLAGEWDTVGNIKRSDKTFSVNGSMTLYDFIDNIFNGTIMPTVSVEPKVSISLIGAGTKEAGSIVNPRLEIGITDGQYKSVDVITNMNAIINSYVIVGYGNGNVNNGINDETYVVRTGGTIATSVGGGEICLPAGYSRRYTVYANVSAQTYAKDNKNKNTDVIWSPEMKKLILANGEEYLYNLTASSETISSYTCGCFYGSSTTAYASNTISSELFRSLNKLTKAYPSVGEEKINFSVAVNAAQILIAVPAGKKAPTLYNNTVYSAIDLVLMANNFDIAASSSAVDPSKYDIYHYKPAIPFRTVNSLTLTLKA